MVQAVDASLIQSLSAVVVSRKTLSNLRSRAAGLQQKTEPLARMILFDDLAAVAIDHAAGDVRVEALRLYAEPRGRLGSRQPAFGSGWVDHDQR